MSAAPTQIVVLYGGRSAEHDVSRVSAARVVAALDPERYRVVRIGIDRDGRWWHDPSPPGPLCDQGLAVTGDPIPLGTFPDDGGDGDRVVFPLVHGPQGEDGTLQGLLELADVAYVGSGVLASAMCMDKATTKAVLGAAGIAQVRYRVMRRREFGPTDAAHHLDEADTASILDDLGPVVFVKPANMGSSVGVTRVSDPADLAMALETAWRYDSTALIEQAADPAREIEVAVLGNDSPRATTPGEIVPGAAFYDYEDKYVTDAATLIVPAPIPDAVATQARRLALEAYEILGCAGLARVDFLYEEGGRGLLVSEINTMPGFTPISMYPRLWAHDGLAYPDLLDELIRLAGERHRVRRRVTER